MGDLRAKEGGAIQVMGSASLAALLIEHDLVDEYRLMIEPILLGGGKRIFPDSGQARALELVSATPTGTGVLICTYRVAALSRYLWPQTTMRYALDTQRTRWDRHRGWNMIRELFAAAAITGATIIGTPTAAAG